MSDSAALHRLAFEAVSDLIFLLEVEEDGGFRCTAANPAFLRAIGMPLSQVTGVSFEGIFPYEAAQSVLGNCREAVRLDRKLTFEERLEWFGGVLYVEMTLHPLRSDDGTILQLFGAARDISEIKMAEQRLYEMNDRMLKLSRTDELTGIANRRSFDEALFDYAEQACLDRTPLSIIMMDIDDFRPFNDHYGQLRGDECLRTIAAELTGHLQRDWCAARYGEEQFAVLLPCAGLWEATAAAERIRSAIELLGIVHEFSPVSSCVTVSLGVCSAVPASIDQARQLLHGSEQAMFEAKNSGKNRVRVKQPE